MQKAAKKNLGRFLALSMSAVTLAACAQDRKPETLAIDSITLDGKPIIGSDGKPCIPSTGTGVSSTFSDKSKAQFDATALAQVTGRCVIPAQIAATVPTEAQSRATLGLQAAGVVVGGVQAGADVVQTIQYGKSLTQQQTAATPAATTNDSTTTTTSGSQLHTQHMSSRREILKLTPGAGYETVNNGPN